MDTEATNDDPQGAATDRITDQLERRLRGIAGLSPDASIEDVMEEIASLRSKVEAAWTEPLEQKP